MLTAARALRAQLKLTMIPGFRSQSLASPWAIFFSLLRRQRPLQRHRAALSACGEEIRAKSTAETQRTQRKRREEIKLGDCLDG